MSQCTINTAKIDFSEILTFYHYYLYAKAQIVCVLCLLYSLQTYVTGTDTGRL